MLNFILGFLSCFFIQFIIIFIGFQKEYKNFKIHNKFINEQIEKQKTTLEKSKDDKGKK